MNKKTDKVSLKLVGNTTSPSAIIEDKNQGNTTWIKLNSVILTILKSIVSKGTPVNIKFQDGAIKDTTDGVGYKLFVGIHTGDLLFSDDIGEISAIRKILEASVVSVYTDATEAAIRGAHIAWCNKNYTRTREGYALYNRPHHMVVGDAVCFKKGISAFNEVFAGAPFILMDIWDTPRIVTSGVDDDGYEIMNAVIGRVQENGRLKRYSVDIDMLQPYSPPTLQLETEE